MKDTPEKIQAISSRGFLKRVKFTLDFISKKSLWLAVFVSVCMLGLILISTVMRYLVGAPFPFTEEVVGHLFMVAAFLTLPYMTMNDRHVDVTLVYDRLPKKGRFFLRMLASALFFAFCAWFAVVTWEFSYFSLEVGSLSETSEMWLFPWMAVMPIVSGLTALISLFKTVAMLWILISNAGNERSGQ